MKKVFFIMLIYFALISCEDELNVMLPYGGNRFVLYSELSPNKVVDLKVERTYPPTGKFELDNTYLTKTIVELYEEQTFVETLKRVGNTNIYNSPSSFKPKIGKSYYFKVKAEGFSEAKSKTQLIPNPIEIISVGFSEEKVVSPLNKNIPTKLLKIKFKKTGQENLYIGVEIEGQFNGAKTSSNVVASKSPAEFGDPCIYDLASFLKIYNSKCYNKDENEITFYIELKGGTQTPPYVETNINNLRIKLSTVDSFYYDFISNYSPPDGIFKAFQPINPTITNVENGFGAVFGKNESIINYRVQ